MSSWFEDPLVTHGGGPAFPFTIPETVERGVAIFKGMTIRDWFAGQALAGWIANPEDISTLGHESLYQQCAEVAYKYADAMLKAREAKP